MKKYFSGFTFVALLAVASSALGAQQAVDSKPQTTRLVVKYKDSGLRAQASVSRQERVQSLTSRVQQPLEHVKDTASGAVVVQLDQPVSLEEARLLSIRIAQDPNVEYAAPDVRVKPLSPPNDSWASNQWQSSAVAQAFGSAQFFNAWAKANATRVTVAVIDTGSVPHSDLSANELLGYDFVSDSVMAGDGNGRDNNPTDEGDYCLAEGTDSSWHGLKVASQIAAVANNSYGIAGAAALNATVLQVRALGRCGGWLTDVADALMWSAGGAVAGAPANASPARVINLSLGAPPGTACFAYMQSAVDFANSVQSVVVAAAGNESANGVGAPASCNGVIVVGAHTRSGDLADYSNWNEAVTLTAPAGGACRAQSATCLSEPTLALGNTGTREPLVEQSATYFSGTSSATPHVAATAAMVLALNSTLTSPQVRSILMATARPHAGDSFCAANATKCGAGMLDADAAMSAVVTPVATLSAPTKPVVGSAQVTLSVSVAGGTAPYTYEWRQVLGPVVTLDRTDAASAVFIAPASKGLPMVFEIEVTDHTGQTTTEMATVRVNNPAVLLAPTSLAHSGTGSFTRTLAGMDSDGDAVQYAVVQAPAGVSVQGNFLSWARPINGTHQIVLLATDGALDGSGDSEHHTLTVVVEGAYSPEVSDIGGAGGGGGGSMSLGGLLLLALATLFGPMLRRRT